MIADIEILKKMFTSDAVQNLQMGQYGKNAVILNEPANLHNSYNVVINNMPEEAIVIKVDAFSAPTGFFANTRGECKRADFMIITNTEQGNMIIFIEMKKGSGNSEEKIVQQLKGAQCVYSYCRAIGKTFWQKNDFLDPDTYNYRFVSIRNIGMNKKNTRVSRDKKNIHDRPELMLKITAPQYLEYRSLI